MDGGLPPAGGGSEKVTRKVGARGSSKRGTNLSPPRAPTRRGKLTGPGHHRRSIRIPEYDYTQPGAYFITCVTYQRLHLFGEIANGNYEFSKLGELAKKEWDHLAKRFPGIELDEYVIMPNHIHGIILINGVGARGALKQTAHLDKPRAPTKEGFGAPVAGSIPTIIRSYKSSVTQLGRSAYGFHSNPIWQKNYFEHVIRNNDEWERIRLYVQENPLNWESDEENIKPLS